MKTSLKMAQVAKCILIIVGLIGGWRTGGYFASAKLNAICSDITLAPMLRPLAGGSSSDLGWTFAPINLDDALKARQRALDLVESRDGILDDLKHCTITSGLRDVRVLFGCEPLQFFPSEKVVPTTERGYVVLPPVRPDLADLDAKILHSSAHLGPSADSQNARSHDAPEHTNKP